jgi:Tol biopolymer transport system component
VKWKGFIIFFLFLLFFSLEYYSFGTQGFLKNDLERLKPSQRIELISTENLKDVSLIAHLDWSPKGDLVAFDDGRDIFVYELTNKSLRRFTLAGEEKEVVSRRRMRREVKVSYSSPEFSPDGAFIVCVRFLGEASELSLLSLSDEEGSSIPNTGGAAEPTWTPDGKRLVFVKNRQLFIINRDGGGLTQLTDLVYASSPNCPITLGRIAFISGLYGNLGIYQMNFNGSDIRLVRKIAGLISFSYSPDGNCIAYCAKKEWAVTSLYVMDAGGNIVREISEIGNANPGAPCWDETGRKLAIPEEALGGTGFRVVFFELKTRSPIFGSLLRVLLVICLAGGAGFITYRFLKLYFERKKAPPLSHRPEFVDQEEASGFGGDFAEGSPTKGITERSRVGERKETASPEEEIKKPGRIKGKVSSDFGKPLFDIQVKILDGLGDVVKEIKSAVDGSFVFEEVLPGTYNIIARSPAYFSGAGSRRPVAISPGAEVSLELVLEKPVFKVAGELYDTTNQFPIADATVELRDETTKEVTKTRTGANGEFELSDLKPGRTYTLKASKEGYKQVFRSRTTFTPGASKVVSKQLELAPAYGVVRGVVMDEEKKDGLSEVIVMLKGKGDPSYEDNTFTDGDGKFQFVKLPEGLFSFSFLKDGYSKETREVEVFSGMDKVFEVNLKNLTSAGGSLKGKVLTIKGRSVPGATVKLVDREGKLVVTTRCSEEGDYLIKGVSPGAYQVTAIKEGVGMREEMVLIKPADEIILPLVLKEGDVELFR